MNYSVDQVADLLGLHVKTVRGYVREGKLKAVRIGKSYRITREDLEAFTGQPAAPPPRRTRHVEASSVVQVDAISPDDASRLANLLISMVQGPQDDGPLRIETLYDEERAVMKVIILGGLATTAEILQVIGRMT